VRATDAAWRQILCAAGDVQGKALYMRKETRSHIMRERNVQELNTLYGVRVVIDPLLRVGEVALR